MKLYNFTEGRMLFGIVVTARYFGVRGRTVVRHIDQEFGNCGGFIP